MFLSLDIERDCFLSLNLVVVSFFSRDLDLECFLSCDLETSFDFDLECSLEDLRSCDLMGDIDSSSSDKLDDFLSLDLESPLIEFLLSFTLLDRNLSTLASLSDDLSSVRDFIFRTLHLDDSSEELDLSP